MLMLHRRDGGWMQLSFVVTNLGPGSGNAVVDLIRLGPPLAGSTAAPGTSQDTTRGTTMGPARTFYRWLRKVGRKDWRASEQSVEITTAAGTLKTIKTGYRATVSIWGYELEVDIRSQGPNWQPGSGVATFPEGGHFALQLAPVTAQFTARERTHSGAWRQFKGTAWVEHGVTNVMPQRLSRRFLRFHGRVGALGIAYMQLETPKSLGADNIGWLVITDGNKVVAELRDPKLTVLKTRRDPRSPHHRVPIVYKVAGYKVEGTATGRRDTSEVSPAGTMVELRVRVGGSLARDDVLESLPGWIRGVISMFVQPVNYAHRARFQIRWSKRTKKGKGVSLFSPMRAPR